MIKRLCICPGCSFFREGDSLYCKKHAYLQVERDQKAKEHAQEYFRNRKRIDASFYNTQRWRQLRSDIIKAHPYCSICGGTENLQCHHAYPPEVPYLQSEDLFFNADAIQVICRDCHNRISDRKGRDRRRSTSLNCLTGDTE